MLPERIKVTTYNQLDEYLKEKTVANLDLSSLDLSIYPEDTWWNVKFYNTDVHNTGIIIDINKVAKNQNYPYFRKPVIAFCDFSNNPQITCVIVLGLVYIEGANLGNTNIEINSPTKETNYCASSLFDVTFPDTINLEQHDWDYCWMNKQTLHNSPHLKISSYCLLQIMRYDLELAFLDDSNEKDIDKLLEYCENLLIYDSEGTLTTAYNLITANFSKIDKLNFFHGYVNNKTFNKIVFNSQILNFLNSYIGFYSCIFNSPIIDIPFIELLKIDYSGIFSRGNQSNNPEFPRINFHSWQEKYDEMAYSKRISFTKYTFRTSVYVELGRECPAHCHFCRNNSYDYCSFNFEAIKDSVVKVIPYVKDIVVGGGEPTLRYDEFLNLMKLLPEKSYHTITFFTNGMISYEQLRNLLESNVKINLSRHAISDEDNAKVFNLPPQRILSAQLIKDINSKHITLCPTLFKGGLDSSKKILEYITFAIEHNVSSILFQTLHEDASLGPNIITEEDDYVDSKEIELTKSILREMGYEESLPIYSTAGFRLTIFKQNNIRITFKEYIPAKDLEVLWINADKKCFDLSIDPCGNIFENWSQQSNPVLTLKGPRK